jgi:hypothetical protein
MNMMAQMKMPPRGSKPADAPGLAAMAVLAATGLAIAAMAWGSWKQFAAAPLAEIAAPAEAPETLQARLKAMPQAARETLTEAQKQRLQADPLDRGAIYNLAQLKSASGDAEAAERLVLSASSRSLRDVRMQAATLEILLRKGEFARALTIMDALARSRPQLQEKLFDQLAALASTREVEPHVMNLLASAPPWRTAFFERIVSSGADPQFVYRLLAALRGTAAPASDTEIRLLLGRLSRDKRFETAYFVWLDLLDDLDLKRVSQVFDGGFDAIPRNLYFDWTISRSRTVDVRIVPRATGSADKVLRVDYVANREAVSPALQYLRLAPGNYVFSGEQRADGLKTENGILWRIVCIDGPGGTYASAPLLSGDMQWSRFDVRFSVPADCPTQQLYLYASSSAVLDQQVSGSAQFDNLTITPIAGAP